MNVRRWRLYVDESGDFSDRDARCAVLGLLVEDGAEGFEHARLERALRAAAPDVPWPIHAWLTRKPAMYLLWPLLAAEKTDAVPPRAHAEALSWALHAHPGATGAYEAAMARLRRGRDPRLEDLETLQSALARASYLAPYTRARRATREALARVAAAAAQRSAASLAFVADAGYDGDGDRYLDALTGLFERLTDALGAFEGAHEVRAHVLGRSVEEPTLGKRVPLHVRHVAACASAAGAALSQRQVRVVPEVVSRFDASTDAALVLADHQVNRVAPLAARAEALRALLASIVDTARMPASLEGLTLAAAAGTPREVVTRARERELASYAEARRRLDQTPDPRPWADEQALEWVGRHLGEVNS